MPPKNNDYPVIKSIQSRYFSFRPRSELPAALASPSEHRGCLFLFHAENHLFHAGNSTNKINLCSVGGMLYVAQGPKDFIKIIVVVGPKPQMRRHYDVFAANKRFLFV